MTNNATMVQNLAADDQQRYYGPKLGFHWIFLLNIVKLWEKWIQRHPSRQWLSFCWAALTSFQGEFSREVYQTGQTLRHLGVPRSALRTAE
jgi:hypothetical protein